MKPNSVSLIALVLICGLGAFEPVRGQALLLSQHVTGETAIEAGVGDTLDIAIQAEFGRLPATGFSLYVTVPEGPFDLVGEDRSDGTLAPFRTGPFFQDALG
jgi:hypothetical protein